MEVAIEKSKEELKPRYPTIDKIVDATNIVAFCVGGVSWPLDLLPDPLSQVLVTGSTFIYLMDVYNRRIRYANKEY